MNINKKQLTLELLRSPLIKQLNESGLWSKSEINRIIAQEILKEAGKADDSDLFSPLAVDTLTPFLEKIRAMENTQELQKMLETNIGALAEVEEELKAVKAEIKAARAEGASRADLADLGDDSRALREEISEIKQTIEAINETLETLGAIGEKVADTPSKEDDKAFVQGIDLGTQDIEQTKSAIDRTNIKTVEPALNSLESGLKDVGEYIQDELPNVVDSETNDSPPADPEEVAKVEDAIKGEIPLEDVEGASKEAIKTAVEDNKEEIKAEPTDLERAMELIKQAQSEDSASKGEKKGVIGSTFGFLKDNWGWFELGIDIGKGWLPAWVGDAYNEINNQLESITRKVEVVAQILREEYDGIADNIAKAALENLERRYQSLKDGGKGREAAVWMIEKAVGLFINQFRKILIEVATETEKETKGTENAISLKILTDKDKNDERRKAQIKETEKFLLLKGAELAQAAANKIAETTGIALNDEAEIALKVSNMEELFIECFGEDYKPKIAGNEKFALGISEAIAQYNKKGEQTGEKESEEEVVSEVLRLLKESGLFEAEAEDLTVEQELEKFKAFLDKKYEGSNVPVEELWNAAQQAEEKEETEVTSLADAGGWKDSKDAARKKITPETTIDDIKIALRDLESFQEFFGVIGPAEPKYEQAIALVDEGYFQKRILDLAQQEVKEENKEAFIEDTTELAATYQEYLDAVAGIKDPDLERLVTKFEEEQAKQKAQQEIQAITIIPNTEEEFEQQFLVPALKIIDITPEEVESKPEQTGDKVISSDLEAQVKALANIEDPKEFFDQLIVIYKQLYAERGQRIPGGLVAAVRKIKEKQASGKKYPEKNVDRLISLMGLEDDFGFESEIIIDKLKDLLVAGRKGGLDKTDISYDKSEIEKIVQGFFDRPTSEMQDTKTAFDNLLSVDDEVRENYVYPAIARVLSRTIQKRVDEIFGMKTRKSKNQTRTLLKTVRNFMEQDGKLDEFFLNQIALEKSFESRKFRKAFGKLKDFVQSEYNNKFSGEQPEQQSDEERMQDMLKMQSAVSDDIMSQERPLGSSPTSGEEGGEEVEPELDPEEPEEELTASPEEDGEGSDADSPAEDPEEEEEKETPEQEYEREVENTKFKTLPKLVERLFGESSIEDKLMAFQVGRAFTKAYLESSSEDNPYLADFIESKGGINKLNESSEEFSPDIEGDLLDMLGAEGGAGFGDEEEDKHHREALRRLYNIGDGTPKGSPKFLENNKEFYRYLMRYTVQYADKLIRAMAKRKGEDYDLQEQRLIRALIPLVESALSKSLKYK